jgi:predicted dehydrogenase
MGIQANRREFLKTAAVTSVGYWVAGGVRAEESKSPNERIGMASVGVDGKGSSDSGDAARSGDMVAICDVDDVKLAAAARRFPKAKTFNDFRKMLEEMGKSIDAVTVSTPDHCHAAASLMAMRMGKHCFCQKPMTRSIYEARLMGQVANQQKVATEMGNQYTAHEPARKAAAQIQAGMLGTVKEVHVWTNRPIWPQGGERPPAADPPETLKWDLWLGPAPVRPYAKGAYHPFNWRGWWDFGSGALGDMACHTVNLPFMALNLRDPISVQAVTSGHNKDSYPKWSIITYEFPELGGRPALKMVWYDGGKKVPPEVIGGKNPAGSGSAIVGDKATMYAPGDYAENEITIIGNVTAADVKYIRSPGHFQEWVRAIRGGEPAMSNFPNYAGPMTETILLGNLAVWVAAGDGPGKECQGEKVLWDAKNMKSTNVSGLETIVKPVFRNGYTLDV